MCRIKYSIVASIVTFMIGVAMACINVALRPPELEQPPCSACAQLYAKSRISSVTICELNKHREYYRGRVVRVSAFLNQHDGIVNLDDDVCDGLGGLHSGLSDFCESCAGAREALTDYTGFGKWWYAGAARVVVAGRIGRLENPTLFDDNNGFNIDCIESVEPMDPGRRNMIWYRLWQFFDYVLTRGTT